MPDFWLVAKFLASAGLFVAVPALAIFAARKMKRPAPQPRVYSFEARMFWFATGTWIFIFAALLLRA